MWFNNRGWFSLFAHQWDWLITIRGVAPHDITTIDPRGRHINERQICPFLCRTMRGIIKWWSVRFNLLFLPALLKKEGESSKLLLIRKKWQL
jgi:hypothetical protein